MATDLLSTAPRSSSDLPAPAARGLAPPAPIELVPAAILVLGGAVTILTVGTQWIDFAYRAPRLHAVIDTTIGLAFVLLAYLVYGRARALRLQRDWILAFALAFAGFINLFAAVNQGVTSRPIGRFGVWTPTTGRCLVAIMFAVAAFIPTSRVTRSARPWRFMFGVTATFGAFMLVVSALSPHLPWSDDLLVAPTDSAHRLLVGPTSLVIVQGITMVAFIAAAWGFSRLRSSEDDLMTWLAAGCMLFGLASFEYLAFPSIFSEFIYVGDFLRLAGVLLLLVGGAREIRGYWQRTAAMEERRKLAHDLHDGVAQELALIATIARRMETDGSTRDTRRLADAAQHALDESRLVISTLAGAGNVAEQLALTARDAGHRFDLAVELDMPETLDLPGSVAEALLRIVREAITNAGHHAGATRVKVQVEDGPPATITVSDDGIGFDVEETTGGFGLTSMRERAEAMGATFTMESLPGQGTTVRVEIP